MKAKKLIILIIASLVSVVVFFSCSSNGAIEKNILTINIFFDNSVNEGSIFYVILRNDGHASFINANNQSLYDEYSKNNENVLFKYINPVDKKKKVVMKTTLLANQEASAYFLFSSEVSQSWKHRFKALSENKTFNIYLKGNRIEKVEEKSFSIF